MKWQIHANWEVYDRGEESVVLYDTASGDTHLISAFAYHLLSALAARPLGTQELVESLSANIDNADAPELATAVPDILKQLAELDLVSATD